MGSDKLKIYYSKYINKRLTCKGLDITMCWGTYVLATSLFNLYETIVGPVSYGSTGDYAHVALSYDKIWKLTTRLDGDCNSLSSDKVWLDTLATTQVYAAVSGDEYQYKDIVNKVYYTERYNASCEWIVQHTYSTADSQVCVTLLSTTLCC